MARPANKDELLKLSEEQFEKLLELIASISEKDINGVFKLDTSKEKEAHWKRDKNVRDILIHLYEWHNLLIVWINNNMKGNLKPFLPEPYNWKTYGEMNIEFWNKHQNTSYEESVKSVKNSHEEVMKLVTDFSNDELFVKSFFPWTGTTNLGSYFISTTSSHYDWAMKKIKKYKKDLESN